MSVAGIEDHRTTGLAGRGQARASAGGGGVARRLVALARGPGPVGAPVSARIRGVRLGAASGAPRARRIPAPASAASISGLLGRGLFGDLVTGVLTAGVLGVIELALAATVAPALLGAALGLVGLPVGHPLGPTR